MLFQATVFAGQILLLVLAWHLFQQAKSQLNARAAETPVLNEIKALHRSIKQLLGELEATADQTSARLENRCAEGRDLLLEMESSLTALREAAEARATRRRNTTRRATKARENAGLETNPDEGAVEIPLVEAAPPGGLAPAPEERFPVPHRAAPEGYLPEPAYEEVADAETELLYGGFAPLAMTLTSELPESRSAAVVLTAREPKLVGVAQGVSPQEARRQAVYRLADAGESAASIARQTGASEGEIEMLLGLRGRRHR